MSKIASLGQLVDRIDYVRSTDESDHFSVTTYHRVEEDGVEAKFGKVSLVKVMHDWDKEMEFEGKNVISTVDFEFGILSQKLEEVNESDYTVSIGCSDGVLRVLKLQEADNSLNVIDTIEVEANPGNDLVLHHDSNDKIYSCAMDTGNLQIFDRAEPGTELHSIKAHEYQMWNVMIDPVHSSIIYTCADDARFKGWDLRAPHGSIFANTTHEYGVCCIKPSPTGDPNVLLTGSYDTSIKIWDKRNMAVGLYEIFTNHDNDNDEYKFQKQAKTQVKIEKSVWDFKFKTLKGNHEEAKFDIMGVMSVYDGYNFIKFPKDSFDCNNISQIESDSVINSMTTLFPEYEGLCYALDYCQNQNRCLLGRGNDLYIYDLEI